MRTLERRLDRLERQVLPWARDTSRDIRMIVSCIGAHQAILATSNCRRQLCNGALTESVHLDGDLGTITGDELDVWIKSHPIIDGNKQKGKPIEVHKLPRVRLPLEAVRSVLQGCRPSPTMSQVRAHYDLTESELQELADEMAPEE